MSDKATRSIQSLQETLDLLQSDWPDLLNSDCNPLDISLPLIEESGLINYQDFKDLKDHFTKKLQKAVNANYMSFNDSIGSYGISIETLNQSQDRLGNIRECLESVDTMINSKSNILGELNSKRMEYRQILNILKEINDVQKKLSNLQDCIEIHDFDKSVNLVKEIHEISIDNRLSSVEGLQSLHTKLETCVTLLLDALIDEIESYIYSKNSTNINIDNIIISNRIPINKGLIGFIKKINGETYGEDEDLEIQNGKYDELYDKFKFVRKLNKENECLSRLVNNSEKEIKQMINRSVNEIRNKFSSQIEMNLSLGLNEKKNPFYSFNLLQGLNGVIIKEVFEKIFKGILYMIQRHVAIFEISKISGYKYKISNILKEVQKQLSLIIFNYIIDENLLNDLEELDFKFKNKKNKSPFHKIPKQFENIEHGPMFQFSKLSIKLLSNNLVEALNNIFVNQNQGIGSTNLNFQNKLDSSIYIGTDDINESKKNILVPPNIFNMAYLIDGFINCTNDLISIYPYKEQNKISNPILTFFNQFMDVVFVSQLENTLIYQFDKLCEHKWKQDQLLDASISFERFISRVLILLDTTLYYRPSYVEIIFKLFYKIDEKFKEVQEILVNSNESKLLSIWINDSKLKMTSNDIVRNLLNEDQNNEENKIKLTNLQSKELTNALSIGGSFIPTMNPNNFMTLERMQSLVDLLASLSNILTWLPKMKRKSPKLFDDIDLSQKLKEIWVLSIFNDSEFPLSLVNLDNDNDKQVQIYNNESYYNNISDYDNNNNNNNHNNNNNNDNNISSKNNNNSNNSNNNNDTNSNNIYLNNSNFENELQGFISLDEKTNKEFDSLIHNFEDLMNDVEILIRYEIRVECIWCMIQMMLNKQWEQTGDESVDLGVDKFCERINNINRILNKISQNITNKSKDEIKIRIFGGLGFWIDKLIIFESRRIEVMGQDGWIKMIVNLRVLQQAIKNIDNDFNNSFEICMNESLKYFTLGMEGEKFIMNMENIKNEGLILNDDDWKNLIRLVYSEKLKNETTGKVNKKYMAAQARLLKSIAPTKNKK